MDEFDLLDHYSVLGVDRDATPGEIDRAYREALLREHPDRSDHPDANARASRVNEAGRVLLDPDRRRQYDPEADSRERRARAGLRHLPIERETAGSSSEGGGDARSHARMDTYDERYSRVGQSAPPRRGADQTGVPSRRVKRTLVASAAVVFALILVAALAYQFILNSETDTNSQPGRAINETMVSEAADDQSVTPIADQEVRGADSNEPGQQAGGARQVVESDSGAQTNGSIDDSQRESVTNQREITGAQPYGSIVSGEDDDPDVGTPTGEDSDRGAAIRGPVSASCPCCQANPNDSDCRNARHVKQDQRLVEISWHTLTGLELASVSSGAEHSCGTRAIGNIVCWGRNDMGETDAPSARFSQVSAGWDHSCGLRTDGGVICWGKNDWGESDAQPGQYSQVSAGWDHNCGLRADGGVV